MDYNICKEAVLAEVAAVVPVVISIALALVGLRLGLFLIRRYFTSDRYL